jgi:hypothetical protein
MEIQVCEAFGIPSRHDQKRMSPNNIIVKNAKSRCCGCTPAVECLSSMHKALSSILSIKKKAKSMEQRKNT